MALADITYIGKKLCTEEIHHFPKSLGKPISAAMTAVMAPYWELKVDLEKQLQSKLVKQLQGQTWRSFVS